MLGLPEVCFGDVFEIGCSACFGKWIHIKMRTLDYYM